MHQVKATRNSKKRSARRSGLTLFEVLLVMVIIVVMAALAVPMLQRSFETQKVVSAADRVRAECGKARVSAMRSGEVYAFYYAENSNFFAVAPFKDAASYVALTSTNDEANRFSDFDFEKNLLPRGCRFVGANVVQDTRAQMIASEDASGQVNGMTPILFYPNGESQSAEIFVMADETGEVMKIKIRGLTGSTSVTACEDQ